jgi:hypothetical protein
MDATNAFVDTRFIPRLNLGAGSYLEGYFNLDRNPKDDRIAKAEAYPLDFFDYAVQEVRASHILEHFSHRETQAVVNEWVRILKPGGILKIAVPDFNYIVNAYREQRDEPIGSYLMGGQVDENDFHKAVFDRDGLTHVLETAGLVDIQPWTSEIQDCAALPVSLNLQGRKPKAGESRLKAEHIGSFESDYRTEGKTTERKVTVDAKQMRQDVRAVMTMPRLAWTDTMFCCVEGVSALGISLEKFGGVFFGQGLSKLFSNHLSDGTKYLLTVDYDTIFKPEDVLQLYATIEANPHIDALCAMQMKREAPSPLFFLRDRDGKPMAEVNRDEMSKDLIQLSSAHFGLTLIRVEALLRIPKPWFHSIPDENGEWGENRCDEDVSFWKSWCETGNTIYQANRIPIGHIQTLITWPDQNLQPIHQYSSDWNKEGKPQGAWQ